MRGEPLTILLVEDNDAHAELVMRSFEGHRAANRLRRVADGEAALDYLNRRGDYSDPVVSPAPHLILLDLRLPKMDGLQLLEEIRRDNRIGAIPIVILTTSQAEQDVAKAYKLHANSYLVKPVNFDKFEQLMDDLGFYWMAWNYYPWS